MTKIGSWYHCLVRQQAGFDVKCSIYCRKKKEKIPVRRPVAEAVYRWCWEGWHISGPLLDRFTCPKMVFANCVRSFQPWSHE